MAIQVNQQFDATQSRLGYLVSDFVMATAIREEFGIGPSSAVKEPENVPFIADEEPLKSPTDEAFLTSIKESKNYRTLAREALKIGTDEQSYRDRAYLINPDHIRIKEVVDTLYDNGVLSSDMKTAKASLATDTSVRSSFAKCRS